MVAHAITANDEHASWPITLGYQNPDGSAVVGIPAGAEWPNGTTVWMVSKKKASTDPPKIEQCVVENLATHEVRRDFTEGDYTNADEGEHDVQWKVRFPDGTTETHPKANVFDTLTVGKNLGDPPAL